MNLYLFGRVELETPEHIDQHFELVNKLLDRHAPKQVLFVPFALNRTILGEEDKWGSGWFKIAFNIGQPF